MPQPIVQVDAFTARPFAGNPAAVCVMPGPADEAWMSAVAREMNLSETAFLYPQGDAYKLRWFTPAVEVPLCGHATLASAHVLWEAGYLPAGAQARFDTLSGRLTADRDGDWIVLDFPARPVVPVADPPDLARALGAPIAGAVRADRDDYLVELASPAAVRALRPDMALLRGIGLRGVIVTSRSDDPAYDFISRFFAPGAGIDEDPVTGSAHCCLGPYWAARTGKSEFVAYQASARGGVVRVRLAGDRVLLGGQAVTVLRVQLV